MQVLLELPRAALHPPVTNGAAESSDDTLVTLEAKADAICHQDTSSQREKAMGGPSFKPHIRYLGYGLAKGEKDRLGHRDEYPTASPGIRTIAVENRFKDKGMWGLTDQTRRRLRLSVDALTKRHADRHNLTAGVDGQFRRSSRILPPPSRCDRTTAEDARTDLWKPVLSVDRD